MRVVKIDSSIEGKLLSGHRTISGKDYERLEERFVPGEWVLLRGSHCFVACANPFGKNGAIVRVSNLLQKPEQFDIDEYLVESIQAAYKKRKIYKYLNDGCRLFYGEEDGLSGLVIDVYQNALIVSVSSFGIWSKKEIIRPVLTMLFPDKKSYFLSAKGVNAIEDIPEGDDLDIDRLEVLDSGIRYNLDVNVLQKGGYYYDHKNNRQKLERFLNQRSEPLRRGLDLFSYVGSWGLHMLRANCTEVEFVDQANMGATILENLKINGYEGKGFFTRGSVYDVLDEKFKSDEKYDIIVADPPAFTKNEKGKDSALRGYEKLHHKCLRLINDQGIYVAASCTSHVSLIELDETVQVSARKLKMKLTLADIGIQSEDHMMYGLKSKANYIKYLLYTVWE